MKGFQNPFSSDALVTALVNVETANAGLTVDVGVAAAGTTTSDTIIDAGSVASVGVLNGADNGGTNGNLFRAIDKKGGSNDYVTWDVSGSPSTLAGQIVIVLFSLNK